MRRVRFLLPENETVKDEEGKVADEAEMASPSSSTSSSPKPAIAYRADDDDTDTIPWHADFSNFSKSTLSSGSEPFSQNQLKVYWPGQQSTKVNLQQHLQARPPPPTPPPLTQRDCELLWYSKKELAVHRKDVRRTILCLRNSGGASLLTPACVEDRSLDSLSASAKKMDDDEICFRGCERYYSLETRFMVQKTLVEAILEAQENMEDDLELRYLSETLSESCKELSIWHAKLNAFQCWGLRGLKLSNEEHVVPTNLTMATFRLERARHRSSKESATTLLQEPCSLSAQLEQSASTLLRQQPLETPHVQAPLPQWQKRAQARRNVANLVKDAAVLTPSKTECTPFLPLSAYHMKKMTGRSIQSSSSNFLQQHPPVSTITFPAAVE